MRSSAIDSGADRARSLQQAIIHAHAINQGQTDFQWRRLFDGIGDALVLMTTCGTLLEINAAATALLGYTSTDVAGRHMSMLYPPSEETRMLDCFATLLRDGTARYSDGVTLTRDGESIAVDVVASLVASCGEPSVIAVVRDIRERKRTENDLQASEARFYALAELIRELFWVCDPVSHSLLYVSPAFAELSALTGCAFHDTQSWRQAILPPDRACFDAFLEAPAHGERATLEIRIACADDSVRWLHCRAFPWSGHGGQALVAGVAEDITERKREESRKLAHAEAERETLLREVHHRIKNSLQGVVGLLRRHAGQHPEMAGALTSAIGQVKSIAAIHELQSGASGGPVMFCELVPMIARSIEVLFNANVKLHVRNGRECMVAIADREAVPLAIVINELLMNAVKHRHAHGENDDSPIEITLEGGADHAVLHICNRGALTCGFDFASRRGLGHGLELLSVLLPTPHAELKITQHNGQVQACLMLLPPIISAPIEFPEDFRNV